MPGPEIDRTKAITVACEARELWIEASRFSFAHEHERQAKQRSFDQIGKITLYASILTLVLSTVTNGANWQPVQSIATVIAVFTTLSALATTICKMYEQHIGDKEDPQIHLKNTRSLSEIKSELTREVGNLVSYVTGFGDYKIAMIDERVQRLRKRIEGAIAPPKVQPINDHLDQAKSEYASSDNLIRRFYAQVEGAIDAKAEPMADSANVESKQRKRAE